MKKVLWLALVLTLALVMIAGCGEAPAEETPVDETPEEETPEEEVSETGTSKLGLGVVTSIAKSRDAGDEDTAQAQADVIMAAVLFDAEGKVVSVSIDNAQTRVPFDEEMQVAVDTYCARKNQSRTR
jgi:predicted small lipoprotein YifL